ARTDPSGASATAATPVVPTSRPTRAVIGFADPARLRARAEGLVDELVRAHRVLATLRLAKGGVVDPARDIPDEAPLEHRPLDGGDRALGVRIEVESEPLPVLAVPGATKLERELECLHEGGRAHHVVVVEGAPARVRMLVAEQALRGEQGRVLGQALPVHEQVLPVHVHLHARDAAYAELVDHV